MNYLLDTCVICEMMKKRPDEKVVKWFCKQEQKTLYLSYLTIGEIQKGIIKRGDDARAKRLKTWFQRLAKETGISAPNLHRALSVRGNPTMRTFGKIAASISAFLGFQTPMAVFS